MIIWTKPCRKKVDIHDWNLFYVWWPRKVILSPKLVPEQYIPAHHWVCFEWLERKYTHHVGPWLRFEWRHPHEE